MKRSEKHFEKHWKKYFMGIGILLILLIWGYTIIDNHLIGKPVIDYTVAFDEIGCCMTYDELVPLLWKGNEAMWYLENEHKFDRFYRIRSIRKLINGIPYGYSFSSSSGMHRIMTEGTKTPETKLTRASLYLNQPYSGGILLKRLDDCVC